MSLVGTRIDPEDSTRDLGRAYVRILHVGGDDILLSNVRFVCEIAAGIDFRWGSSCITHRLNFYNVYKLLTALTRPILLCTASVVPR